MSELNKTSQFSNDILGFGPALYNFMAGRGLSETDFYAKYTQGKDVVDQVLTFMNGKSERHFYDEGSWQSCSSRGDDMLLVALAALGDPNIGIITLGRPYSERTNSCIPNVIFHSEELPVVCKVGNIDDLSNSALALQLLDVQILHNLGIFVVPNQLFSLPGTKLGMMLSQKIHGKKMSGVDWKNPEWLRTLVLHEVHTWFKSYESRHNLGARGTGLSPVDYTSDGNAIMLEDGRVYIIDADMRTISGKSTNPSLGVSGQIVTVLYEELRHLGIKPEQIGIKYFADEKRFEFI